VTIRLLLSSLAVAAVAMPAMAADPLAELEAAGNEDPQAWYEAAKSARSSGAPEEARRALARASELGLSPLRAGFERARILVAEARPEAAVDELQTLVDNGFTAVSAITGDPVLATLAGRADFDQLVAALALEAYPCDNQARFRAFDFWIGDWDVHTADGRYAGHNTIAAEERGCVLVERWQGAGGGTGMSINYLDAANDEWVQVWNSAAGGQIEIRGGMTDEGMSLTGTIHYVGNGTTAPFRGLWTPLPDGRVRQYFEQSNDGGKTWTPWFEGFYTRSENAGEERQ